MDNIYEPSVKPSVEWKINDEVEVDIETILKVVIDKPGSELPITP
jgi:hypothetical protein